MKKILFGVVVLAGFALLIPTRLVLAANFNINIKDNFFTPFAPMIQPGDTVTWTNAGAMPHTVTADDNSFDSGEIEPGGTFSRIFSQGSVINYYCKLHSTAYEQGGRAMNAVILINGTAAAQGTSAPPPPPPDGGSSPSPSPSFAPAPAPAPTPAANPAPGLQMSASPTSTLENSYPTGSLINDSGTIYLIVGKNKLPFTNFGAFKGLGYSLKNVTAADSSAYGLSQNYQITSSKDSHPWSSWLLNKGTIYYSHETGLIGVADYNTFLANGGKKTLILPANSADLAILKNNPNLPVLQTNDPRIYK